LNLKHEGKENRMCFSFKTYKSCLYLLLMCVSCEIFARAQAGSKELLQKNAMLPSDLIASMKVSTGLQLQRTDANRLDGPVLYQIIFRSSATPGAIPKISPKFTLTNSLISEVGGGLQIGGPIFVNAGGVLGFNSAGSGVFGSAINNNFGVTGKGDNGGVQALNQLNSNAAYLATGCCAGFFTGNVQVQGDLSVSGAISAGTKDFKIDHPLDPTNKYLYHASVESSEMKNIYDGVTVLDRRGQAWVSLPDWFEALNMDFRYQLTAIGAPGPNLYIARSVTHNRFKIAGGKPHHQVSWQVTGIRHDAYANAHRIEVEQEKPGAEKGTYLYPELFGEPDEKGLGWMQGFESKQQSMSLVNTPTKIAN
jgi:hypothetical protein